jgi:predicted permease
MDFKLALRMLIRYPGLTLVGVLGMAVGITITAGAFAIIYTFLDPALPFDEGDRIVAIQTWDTAKNQAERRIVHDFISWRGGLQSVQELGAFRQVSRNLIAPGGQAETVRVAEMSAAGFRVPRVAPLLGRHLLDEDERAGAAPVLVIAADIWRTRFAGDPAVVGRTVQLGATTYTIVGVMPEGFLFPVNDRLWVPFRADGSRHQPRQGPSITVFGRLAPGASVQTAQAELTSIGQRAASASPATHEKLRPMVAPYTYPFFGMEDASSLWFAHLLQFLISLLLVVVCVNVAILVYARTATRHGEIAVRTALGASRGRIVAQLFVEALALAAIAAVVGLLLTSVGLEQVNAAMVQIYPGLPFWWQFRLSPGVVAYVAVLALLAAAIVGVIPAIKATGGRVHLGLQQISAGGGGGMQFGRTWTILIVLQVAIAVALLPAAVFHAWDSSRYGLADPGVAAKEFLTVQVVLDRPNPPEAPSEADEREIASRYADRLLELTRRLEGEPGISNITFSSSVPGGEATAWIEADGVRSPQGPTEEGGWVAEGSRAGHEVRFNRVGLDYFDAFDVPLLVGRGFSPADAEGANPQTAEARTGEGAVIVNQSFVRNVLGGGAALGRRVRYVGASNDAEPGDVALGRWYEIVGVVADFPARPTESGLVDAKLYHAAGPGQISGATLALRIRGTDPGSFAGRLREVGVAVDPNLQVRNVATLDAVLRQEQGMLRLISAVLVVLTFSVLVLSSAGIYALMSFTVSQRRKEIGIRAALGADPRRIFVSLFSRALWQMVAGAVLGGVVAGLLELATDGGLMSGNGFVVLPIVAAVVMIVGLLAVLGPARRGLRIHPTEALRER